MVQGSWVALPITGVAGLLVARLWFALRQHRRAEFIRSYEWPAGLLNKLVEKYPQFQRKETSLVSKGLRQFFLAYLLCGKKYVAMPSEVADDLWHEFILYTRAYDAFCKAAFGSFLHHTPAVVLKPGQKRSNEGLRRMWWWCCKDENIDARKPSRLPLLFALDTKLKIPGGYVYVPDCGDLRKNGNSGTQCGGDFGSSSVDGGTDGFPSDSNGSDSFGGDSSGDSGGGDGGGGGCGGGGD